METKAITSLLVKQPGPAYMRLGKAGEPVVHESEPTLHLGKAISLKKGNNVAVLSTGAMLKYAWDYISLNKVDCSLFSFPFVKPLDKLTLMEIAKTHKEIITIEEHQKSAGFGSAILEGLNDLSESSEIETMPKVRRIAIPDKFINISGSQEYLRKLAGLALTF
jgi:transketolase